MEDIDLNLYLPIFIEECKENIQQISANLLRLEHDAADSEAINEVFRAVHTIKGMAATMGYGEISQLAHSTENLLDAVRRGQAKISSRVITALFHIIDELEAQLNALETTGAPCPIGEQRLQGLLSLLPELEPLSEQLHNSEPETPSESVPLVGSEPLAEPTAVEATYLLEIFLDKECQLPQARAMIIYNQLASLGTMLRSEPPLDQLPELAGLELFKCWVAGIRPEQVRALLDGGIDIDYYTIEKVKAEPTATDAVAASIDPEQTEPVGKLTHRPETHHFRHTIRVDIEKLDQLLNLVSELVINKTALQQGATAHPQLAEGVEHLHRLTSELQTVVMKMRMIPLETVFNRFPRMVRDTALSLDKLVNLEISGADTELDRTIIEDIADPILHLLRNAIDHGIESVAQRQQKGKPRTGTVSLKAFQTGNKVVIEVSDDGRGLDLEQIRAKAREQQLLSFLESETKDLASCIFTPGFSTAGNVTDLSGRGVGLDVVKNSIEALGGGIDVFSVPDAGTTFTISLPLTLAIIQGLLVRSGREIYAIPLSYVEETGIFFSEDVRTVGQQEIIMLRGKVLPIVFLNQLLATSSDNPEELNLVVVRYGERQLGIVVDDLLAQQDVVIKNVNWGERFFRMFLGCSILGDGSVVMILDINALLSVAKVRGVNNA